MHYNETEREYIYPFTTATCLFIGKKASAVYFRRETRGCEKLARCFQAVTSNL